MLENARRAGSLLEDAGGTEARCLPRDLGNAQRNISSALQDSAKPVRPGETIYKGHHSYDLMRNLQLGIIFSTAKSVEQSTGGGFKDPVKDEDFMQQVRPRTFLPSRLSILKLIFWCLMPIIITLKLLPQRR